MLDVAAWGEYRLLGRTRDDAAGEAFDKVAKLLGLPYPGGPAHRARLADAASDERTLIDSRGRCCVATSGPADADYYDVSFSGLKTAVLNAVRSRRRRAWIDDARRDRARLSGRAHRHARREDRRARSRQFGRSRVVLGGGVACNATLVAAMRARVAPRGASVFAPSARLATDNAAMIARAGLFHLERGERSALDLNAFASQPFPDSPTSLRSSVPRTHRLPRMTLADPIVHHPFSFTIGPLHASPASGSRC